MKKKTRIAALLITALVVSMLAGCASSKSSQGSTEEGIQSAVQPTNKGGKVALTVWAEESTFEGLNQMVESFKKEYEG